MNVARTDGYRSSGLLQGRGEGERAMWSLAVVVIDVGPKHLIEMPTTPDKQPVQALGPHRFNPALRVRVRVRRPR